MTVSIISSATWGAKPWNGTPATVSLKTRAEFFVHYDGGSPITRTGYAIMRVIEAEHISSGWSGVGYNFVVDQAGNLYEGRGWTLQGAHCPGHNISGLAVQFAIGGDQEPSVKVLASARVLYEDACKKTGRPLAKNGRRGRGELPGMRGMQVCPLARRVAFSWSSWWQPADLAIIRRVVKAPGCPCGAFWTLPPISRRLRKLSSVVSLMVSVLPVGIFFLRHLACHGRFCCPAWP